MLRFRSWCVLPCAMILFASCSVRPPVLTLDTHMVSAGELIATVRERGSLLHSLSGSGSLAFESPAMAGSAFFTLSLRKPDSLLVQLEGPFGIDVGTLLLTRERFLLYNNLENTIRTGPPDPAIFRSVLPVELTIDQVMEAFSGVFTIQGSLADVRSYDVDGDRFRLVIACGSGECTYWVDPETAMVTAYRQTDGAGRVLVEATAGSLAEDGAVVAPRRVRISLPSSGRRVSVAYTRLIINDPEPSFAFTIPPSAEVIER
jgi:hypothetical protein